MGLLRALGKAKDQQLPDIKLPVNVNRFDWLGDVLDRGQMIRYRKWSLTHVAQMLYP